MKKIALLCSGGDSPGMNCAIRAVVRTAIFNKFEVLGVIRGYQGLLDKRFKTMNASSVGNILQLGGTILQTSRCPEWLEKDNRKKAADILKSESVDALVVIGGTGSYNGAYQFSVENNFPVIGLPGTIDNDVSGTDYSIGFDTAVQTAVEAVDKIRDTAHSHERTFIVEVMGRKSPAIALHVGICSGAENTVLPGSNLNVSQIANDIQRGLKRGKSSSIIIVAEGDKPGLSHRIQTELMDQFQIPSHVCILGHVQRGGNPTAIDRFLASRMGNLAVDCLLKKNLNQAISYVKGEVVPVALKDCLDKKDVYLPHFENLLRTLSI